jgi:hypothetical protein
MIISIHPLIDQLAQHIDGQVCKRKKVHLQMPFELRLYLVVRLLRHQLKLRRRKDLEARIDYFDPAEDWFSAEENSKFGTVRHVIRKDEEWDRFDTAAAKYVKALQPKLHARAIDHAMTHVVALFRPITNGDFKIVDWDEYGRMEFEASSKGARELGSKPGERFFSFVGLLETGRANTWAKP